MNYTGTWVYRRYENMSLYIKQYLFGGRPWASFSENLSEVVYKRNESIVLELEFEYRISN